MSFHKWVLSRQHRLSGKVKCMFWHFRLVLENVYSQRPVLAVRADDAFEPANGFVPDSLWLPAF